MKTDQFTTVRIVFFLLAFAPLFAKAEDWTTTDGQVYKSVTVIKVEADAVTILDDCGGGLVPLSKLPATLQARFHYDPSKANVAAAARAAAEQQNTAALENEEQQAETMKNARYVTEASPADASLGGPSAAPTDRNASGISAPKLTADEKASIQSQINALQADIAFMQADQAKLMSDGRTLASNGAQMSHGGYQGKIANEQTQIQNLQAQLASN